MIIYEAINIENGKRYIGQTQQKFEIRKRQHLNSIKYHNSGCTHFKRALIKYGVDKFVWSVIDTANNTDELNVKESFWIEFFDTTNPSKGYNLKGGGYTPYLTSEVKKSIGKAQQGKLNHMFGKLDNLNKTSKPMIDLTTNKIFYSVSEYCRQNQEFSISKVCAVCRGTRYTYKSHIFRYLDKDGNIIDNGNPTTEVKVKSLKHNNLSHNPKLVAVVDLTNNIKYKSKTDAVGKRYLSSFSRKLKNFNGDCVYHGIHWKLLYNL